MPVCRVNEEETAWIKARKAVGLAAFERRCRTDRRGLLAYMYEDNPEHLEWKRLREKARREKSVILASLLAAR